MPSIHPYLYFDGQTEAAFAFYQSVFGGQYLALQRFKDMPGEHQIPADSLEKIMHITLPIGEGHVLMGSDTLDRWGPDTFTGRPFALSIAVESQAEADRVFAALADGGEISMPMQKQFWGSYFGVLTDKFNVQWMVSFAPKAS